MASSGPRSTEHEAGFATPAAAAVSLALALVAAASVTAAVTELKRGQADLTRAQAEYALAGAQQRAALTILQAKPASRYGWSVARVNGQAQALAESEYLKLSFKAAAQLDDATLAKLKVGNPTALRSHLGALAAANDLDAADLVAADPSPLWRACAPSLISPYGAAAKANAAPATNPIAGGLDWRVGEVWRLRVALPSGWTDDRIVRFTGDARHPSAVIERRFFKSNQGVGQCDVILAAN